MTRRHDETTGRWFDEDMERCSACYLNHGHTFQRHIASIADRECAIALDKPLWAINSSAALYDRFTLLRKQWLATFGHTLVLHDTARI